uniref:Uncharacterized protein n=1 Tax=Rhizophora mucronata TaxID=61149 RepID=A0A2P2JEU8_RHIMU
MSQQKMDCSCCQDCNGSSYLLLWQCHRTCAMKDHCRKMGVEWDSCLCYPPPISEDNSNPLNFPFDPHLPHCRVIEANASKLPQMEAT